jgi:hypothetical protein
VAENMLDAIFGPEILMALCDECRQARACRTEREREIWLKHHTHGSNS